MVYEHEVSAMEKRLDELEARTETALRDLRILSRAMLLQQNWYFQERLDRLRDDRVVMGEKGFGDKGEEVKGVEEGREKMSKL